MVKKMKEGDIVTRGDYRYQERGGKLYNFNVTAPEKKKKKAAPTKPKPKVEKPEVKMPKRPFTPTPAPKPEVKGFNPLTSTGEVPNAKTYGDVSPLPEAPPGKRFNPLTSTYYKDGGRVRGDGMSRVKTKGRCL